MLKDLERKLNDDMNLLVKEYLHKCQAAGVDHGLAATHGIATLIMYIAALLPKVPTEDHIDRITDALRFACTSIRDKK